MGNPYDDLRRRKKYFVRAEINHMKLWLGKYLFSLTLIELSYNAFKFPVSILIFMVEWILNFGWK